VGSVSYSLSGYYRPHPAQRAPLPVRAGFKRGVASATVRWLGFTQVRGLNPSLTPLSETHVESGHKRTCGFARNDKMVASTFTSDIKRKGLRPRRGAAVPTVG